MQLHILNNNVFYCLIELNSNNTKEVNEGDCIQIALEYVRVYKILSKFVRDMPL